MRYIEVLVHRDGKYTYHRKPYCGLPAKFYLYLARDGAYHCIIKDSTMGVAEYKAARVLPGGTCVGMNKVRTTKAQRKEAINTLRLFARTRGQAM